MTSEEARKYLETGDLEANPQDSQPSGSAEESPNSSPAPMETTSTEETGEQHEETLPPDGGQGEDGSNTADNAKPGQPDNTKPSGSQDDKLPYKEALTDRERKANKAFIKQKKKLKEKEAEIEVLKGQLKKYEGVTHDDLGNDPEKVSQFDFNKRMLQHDIQKAEQDHAQMALEAAEEQATAIREARVEACFPDPAERNEYNAFFEKHREAFSGFLAKADPQGSIIEYLNDSPNSPLLTAVLMSNPKITYAIVAKQSPMSKFMELKNLENRILVDRKLRSSPSFKQAGRSNSTPHKLPSTGKQVGNPGTPGSTVRNKQYWENYLNTHH